MNDRDAIDDINGRVDMNEPRELLHDLLLLVIVLALFAGIAAMVSAQEASTPEVHHEVNAQTPGAGGKAEPPHAGARVPFELLARACFAEASYRESDCAAIHHVLMRRAERAGVTYERMTHAYTAVDRVQREPSGPAWERLQVYAARIVAGHVATPCPGATHWGGLRLRGDRENAERMLAAGKWRRVQCSKPTANTFFAEMREVGGGT